MTLRPDLARIVQEVPAGVRAIDVGCGEGDLMDVLRARGVDVRGMEIDGDLVEIGEAFMPATSSSMAAY